MGIWNPEDERDPRVFAIATYLSIGSVTAFFSAMFVWSPLSAWDTPGHVFAASYFEKHLWPWFSGWNSLAFGGFPQGYLYPSLLHWLAGGLGKLIGITASLKFFIVLSLALLPFSLTAFLNSLEVRGYSKLLALIWIFVFLTVAPNSVGGTFQGLLSGGLLPHQFAMPLYFFYLTCLKKGTNSTPHLISAGALLALITLAHAFVALGAALAFLVYLFIFFRSKRLAIRFGSHLLLAFFLTLFWTVPFFLFREFQSGRYLAIFKPLWFLAAALLTITGFGIARKIKSNSIHTIACLLSGLLVPLFLSGVVFPHLNLDFALHMHRLWVFAVIYGLMILSFAMGRLRLRSIVLGLSIFIFIGAFLRVYSVGELQKSARIFLSHPFDHQPGLIAVPRNSTEENDVLAEANARHLLSNSFLMQGEHLLSGLFIESAGNGAAINGALVEMMGKPYIWGVRPYDSNRELLSEHLKYLGVCWIGTFHPEMIDASMKSLGAAGPSFVPISMQINNQSIKKDLSVFRIPCSRAEVISSIQVVPDAEWKQRIKEWWIDKKAISTVLVSAPVGETHALQVPVRLEELSAEHFRASIDSSLDQFVYLKVPYFPNWHAYVNGNEIPVYRAAPNQMVIKARGVVDLRFERSRIELICYAISLLAWIMVFGFLVERASRPLVLDKN